MYLKTKCTIKTETKEAHSLTATEECDKDALFLHCYSIYFNLDEFPRMLESSNGTDPIILPNGSPLNCLLYADDLILISSSAACLQ